MSDDDEPRGYVHFSAAYHELPTEVTIRDDQHVFMWADKETCDRQKAQGVKPMLEGWVLAPTKFDFEAPTTRIRWKLIAELGLLPIPGTSPPMYGVELQFSSKSKRFAVRAPADVTREENADCVIGRDVLDHVHRYGDKLLFPYAPPSPPPSGRGLEELDRPFRMPELGAAPPKAAEPPQERPAPTDVLLRGEDLRAAFVARIKSLEPYVRAAHAEALELGTVAPVIIIAEPSDSIGAAIRARFGHGATGPCVVCVAAADLLEHAPRLWPTDSVVPSCLQLVKHGDLVVLMLSHMSSWVVFIDELEKVHRPAPVPARPSTLN